MLAKILLISSISSHKTAVPRNNQETNDILWVKRAGNSMKGMNSMKEKW